jgi:hypothetical protein
LDDTPVQVIGGVVPSCVDGDKHTRSTHSKPSVSLMLASLPGVCVTPFHVTGSALPELPASTWRTLVRPAPTDPADSGTTRDADDELDTSIRKVTEGDLAPTTSPHETGTEAAASLATIMLSTPGHKGIQMLLHRLHCGTSSPSALVSLPRLVPWRVLASWRLPATRGKPFVDGIVKVFH